MNPIVVERYVMHRGEQADAAQAEFADRAARPGDGIVATMSTCPRVPKSS